jgi:hypothetical protein
VRRRSLLALPLAALPLAGCSGRGNDGPATGSWHSAEASGSPAVVTKGGGPVPLRPGKVMLGAYVALRGLSTGAGLALRRRQLGRDERIVHRYYQWTDRLPVSLSYLSAHSTLMLSWRGPHYRDVNDGSSDRLIMAAARRMAARRRPTLVRWAWDMNRDFYRWGGAANDRDTAGYVSAWRRLHRLFREAGADNVSWVWSPNATSHPDEEWNQYPHYYPGDAYVDWVGVSGYAEKETPGELFGGFYDAYAPRKPIMITEVAVADRGGTTKPDWITGFARWVKSRPAVGAVVWFDTDTHPGSDERWRIDSQPASLAAYRAMAADPAFAG